MAISQYGNEYYGLSGDNKPLGTPLNGRKFTEMDTSKEYRFDAENQQWLLQSGGGGGASTLSGLTDVDITNPTDGQVLVYNAETGKWENGASGGSLLVTLTMTENQEENQEQKGSVKGAGTTFYTITADKTAGEIWDALKTGRCVFFTFTDNMVNNEEYVGYMGPAHYGDAGFFFGTADAPVEGLTAATANDYPSEDRYEP